MFGIHALKGGVLLPIVYEYFMPFKGGYLEGYIEGYNPTDAAKEAVRHEIEELGSDIRDGEQSVKLVTSKGRCYQRIVKVDTVITYDCIA